MRSENTYELLQWPVSDSLQSAITPVDSIRDTSFRLETVFGNTH